MNPIRGRTDHSPEYNSWRSMKERCHRPKSKDYHLYGGKGVKVCDRWLGVTGFCNFLSDMGKRPTGTTLDRIDNDGNYEPENCRWATAAEQGANTCRVRLVTISGETKSIRAWCKYFGINYGTVNSRLGDGWPTIKAITTPKGRRGVVVNVA